jgi:putative FmdB family regulatory protein
MPFYEYECPHCGYDEEVLQKITDKPLKKCPSCGKNGLRKLMSAPVFRLKGSGWYETDFKSDKENKRNLAGADKDDSADKKSETKAETRTESKSETGKVEAAKPAAADSAPDKPADKSADKPAKRASSRAKVRHKVARRKRR